MTLIVPMLEVRAELRSGRITTYRNSKTKGIEK